MFLIDTYFSFIWRPILAIKFKDFPVWPLGKIRICIIPPLLLPDYVVVCRKDMPSFPYSVSRISPALYLDIRITLIILLHPFKNWLPVVPPSILLSVLSMGCVPYPGVTLNYSNEFFPQLYLAICPCIFPWQCVFLILLRITFWFLRGTELS